MRTAFSDIQSDFLGCPVWSKKLGLADPHGCLLAQHIL